MFLCSRSFVLSQHNHFNLYVVNLAVTDVSVAVFAMSFYTFDVLLGRWPFGEFMCGVWIFFDYGMTFASVFTLVAISVDRYRKFSFAWTVRARLSSLWLRGFILVQIEFESNSSVVCAQERFTNVSTDLDSWALLVWTIRRSCGRGNSSSGLEILISVCFHENVTSDKPDSGFKVIVVLYHTAALKNLNCREKVAPGEIEMCLD